MSELFTSNAVSTVNFCALPKTSDKERRYKNRLRIIAEGKASPDLQKRVAAERLERNNKAVESTKLSKDVYNVDNNPLSSPNGRPEGWDQVIDEKELNDLGLNKSDLIDSETGFKAAVYKSKFQPAPPKYVIAFAGTDSLPDMSANLGQGLGRETEQYNSAMEIARRVKNRIGAENVEFTGHSLGGGLASAASVVTGSKAITINSAGLNENTVTRLGIDKDVYAERSKNIDAFYSGSDPLNNLQDNFILTPEAAGNRFKVSVPDKDQHSWLGLIAPVMILSTVFPVIAVAYGLYQAGQMALDGHSVDQMIVNIENEKNQDEFIIDGNERLIA